MTTSSPRSLVKVIHQIIAIFPELKDALHSTLRSVMYSSPEMMGTWWIRTAEVLQEATVKWSMAKRQDLQIIFSGDHRHVLTSPTDEKCAEALSVLVREAQRIREQSYDQEAADNAIKQEKPATHPIDFNKFYHLSIEDAAELACLRYPLMQTPVKLLITLAWNDAQDWANEIKEL